MKPLTKTIVLTMLIWCPVAYKAYGDTPQTFKIKLDNSEDISFDDARLRVTLYGSNNWIADTIATPIREITSPINALPSEIDMVWPKNIHELIKNPEADFAEQGIYYIADLYIDVYKDINFERHLCKALYHQDFSATPSRSFEDKPGEPVTISLKENPQSVCEPAPLPCLLCPTPTPTSPPTSPLTPSPGGISAAVNINNDYDTGYCAKLSVTNNGNSSVTWVADVEIEGAVFKLWNGYYTQEGSTLTIYGVDWNGTLQPGESDSSIGFCASR